GIVTKLEQTTGGVIKCTNRDETVTFRFSEVMKDSFQIAEGDLLEFTIVPSLNDNGSSSAIRIKLRTKELSKNGSITESHYIGVVEKDVGDFRPINNQSVTTPISATLPSMPNDGSSSKQQEPGIISYEKDGKQCMVQFFTSGISNPVTLYCGDKVEFSVSNNVTSKQSVASNIKLTERSRVRGWIAIFRENRGFIEQKSDTKPILFLTSSIASDPSQLDLGDEVEFSLRKSTGRLIAENILKVPSTINNFYSTLPTPYRGRVVSPVRMLNNEECEVFGKIQKITDDGIPSEFYTYSITGVKNKRVILLPNDPVTFLIGVGLDYSTRAVNIVLENELRKGKVDTVKGQYGFIDFSIEENKKIFFHNSEVDSGFDLRPGDDVEFIAYYNQKSGKPCASKLRRLNNLQRPERLITKLKTMNIDETKRKRLVIIRQPRNADEKSKGFTTARIERRPGMLLQA
ncbi:unnamed protein product, partial [Didymodactylos carnosus]